MSALPSPAVSVEEYIANYAEGGQKPAYEFVDGLLVQKTLPTREHSQVQRNLILHLGNHYEGRFDPLPELTTRVAKTRFYVPDIAVEDANHPISGSYPGPDNPVYLCIEIKSPSDRIPSLWGKCVDYHKWGVRYCWIIDPERKLAWEYFDDDYQPRPVDKALAAGEITIPLDSVFHKLG